MINGVGQKLDRRFGGRWETPREVIEKRGGGRLVSKLEKLNRLKAIKSKDGKRRHIRWLCRFQNNIVCQKRVLYVCVWGGGKFNFLNKIFKFMLCFQ